MKKLLPASLLILIFIFFQFHLEAQEDCKVLISDIAGTYSGKSKKGFAHGRGIAKGRDTYEGSFKKGLPDGKGTYTWSTGEKYIGEWDEGKRDGVGIYYYWEDNEKVSMEGLWVDNRYVGPVPERPKVGSSVGIERYSFQRQGEGYQVKVTTYINGVANVDLENLIFQGSSGAMFVSGGSMGYEGIIFPFKCVLTYYSWNRLRTVRVFTRFEFEITQPGIWAVIVHNN